MRWPRRQLDIARTKNLEIATARPVLDGLAATDLGSKRAPGRRWPCLRRATTDRAADGGWKRTMNRRRRRRHGDAEWMLEMRGDRFPTEAGGPRQEHRVVGDHRDLHLSTEMETRRFVGQRRGSTVPSGVIGTSRSPLILRIEVKLEVTMFRLSARNLAPTMDRSR